MTKRHIVASGDVPGNNEIVLGYWESYDNFPYYFVSYDSRYGVWNIWNEEAQAVSEGAYAPPTFWWTLPISGGM